jgi:hypothetical protein
MALRQAYIDSIKAVGKELNKSQDLMKTILKYPKYGLGGYGTKSPVSQYEHILYSNLESLPQAEFIHLGESAIDFGVRSNLFWNNYFNQASIRMKTETEHPEIFHNDIYRILLNQGQHLEKGFLLDNGIFRNFGDSVQNTKFDLIKLVRKFGLIGVKGIERKLRGEILDFGAIG